jgi:hypothetical protein
MKKTRGLYHVFERRYLNFSSRTFLKILVIHTAPTVCFPFSSPPPTQKIFLFLKKDTNKRICNRHTRQSRPMRSWKSGLLKNFAAIWFPSPLLQIRVQLHVTYCTRYCNTNGWCSDMRLKEIFILLDIFARQLRPGTPRMAQEWGIHELAAFPTTKSSALSSLLLVNY